MLGFDISPGLNVAAQNSNNFRRPMLYANPYFDMAQTYLPKQIKELFAFSRWTFYAHDIIRSIVRKASDYPITELIYNLPTDTRIGEKYKKQAVQAWKHHLEYELEIREVMRGMLMDYWVYGNSFVLPIVLREFYYRCEGCSKTFTSDSDEIKLSPVSDNGKTIRHKCETCGDARELIHESPKDAKIRSIKMLRLNPQFIDIEHNPLTGESTYYFTVPESVRRQITGGNADNRGFGDYIRYMPKRFLDAAITGEKIRFRKDRLYHFRSPELAEEDMGWGKPQIMSVFRAIHQMQIVRNAEEKILMEHLVPLRIIYPAAANGNDPAEMIDLGAWQNQMQQWLAIWKRDQNMIPISGFPVGVANVGGDAKALLSTPQLQEFYKLAIINGCGMPREFIEGGLSFSASSMSLRMLHNDFQNQRIGMQKFIDFSIAIGMAAKGLPLIAATFSDLQFADDVQKTGQRISLAQGGVLSWTNVCANLGVDYLEQQEIRKRELAVQMDMKKMESRAQSQAASEGMLENARASAMAEYENFKAKEALQRKENQEKFYEAQKRRRESAVAMPEQELMSYVMSGNLSVSDVLYLVNKKRIPATYMNNLTAGVRNLQNQVLAQFGVNPETLDGLPADLAVLISNLVMPPNDIGRALNDIQQANAQQQQQQQAQQQAQQPPPEAPPEPEPVQKTDTPEMRAKKYVQEIQAAGSPSERSMVESRIRSEDPEGFELARQMMSRQAPPQREGQNPS
jgi:hypothetical protein